MSGLRDRQWEALRVCCADKTHHQLMMRIWDLQGCIEVIRRNVSRVTKVEPDAKDLLGLCDTILTNCAEVYPVAQEEA